MDANKTRKARSVSLKDVQGPVFIQSGGHMNISFQSEGRQGSFEREGNGMLKSCLALYDQCHFILSCISLHIYNHNLID